MVAAVPVPPHAPVLRRAAVPQQLRRGQDGHGARGAGTGRQDEHPPGAADAALRAAGRAQVVLASWPEERLEALLQDLADAACDAAQRLARQTVAETGVGDAADKTEKNLFAARDVLRSVLGRPGAGTPVHDEATGVTEVARPVGVVLALLPLTNPVATLFSTLLIAVKARNALVVRAHPRAARVTSRAVLLLRDRLVASGAPADLLRDVLPGDREELGRLLRHDAVDLVVATGSTSLVQAACASGTPTLGAGSGNAPAWVCDDADVRAAAEAVVRSKSFDNGVICGSEQHLLVDAAVHEDAVAALQQAGAEVLSPAQAAALGRALFAGGRVRRDLVGRPAPVVAAAAQLRVDPGTRLLVAPVAAGSEAGPWGLERLVPVVALHRTAGTAHALALCRALLGRSGAGHTAAVHTRSRDRALAFAAAVPVGRVIVNGPAAQGCIGHGTGLVPSLTLACGPAGGATTTDNITYRHLMQVSRIAWPRDPDPLPPRP